MEYQNKLMPIPMSICRLNYSPVPGGHERLTAFTFYITVHKTDELTDRSPVNFFDFDSDLGKAMSLDDRR